LTSNIKWSFQATKAGIEIGDLKSYVDTMFTS